MKKLMKQLTALLLAGVLMMTMTACRKEYTSGEVVGDTYTNEWAEVKVTVPSGYKMLDTSSAGRAPSGFDMGAAFVADASVTIPACYVLTRQGEADIEEIGESFTQEFGGTSGMMNISQGGTTYQVTITKSYYTIAGESYLCFHLGVSVADVYCAFRDVDGTGVIAICVVTMNGYGTDDEDAIFDMFEKT